MKRAGNTLFVAAMVIIGILGMVVHVLTRYVVPVIAIVFGIWLCVKGFRAVLRKTSQSIPVTTTLLLVLLPFSMASAGVCLYSSLDNVSFAWMQRPSSSVTESMPEVEQAPSLEEQYFDILNIPLEAKQEFEQVDLGVKGWPLKSVFRSYSFLRHIADRRIYTGVRNSIASSLSGLTASTSGTVAFIVCYYFLRFLVIPCLPLIGFFYGMVYFWKAFLVCLVIDFVISQLSPNKEEEPGTV